LAVKILKAKLACDRAAPIGRSWRFAAKEGFTLVELLVVIAIIGILAALLLSALSQAKYQAKNTVCRNNLHQIDLALSMYATEQREFPAFYTQDSIDGPGSDGTWWVLLKLPIYYVYGTNIGSVPVPIPWQRLGGVFSCPLNGGLIGTMGFGTGEGKWQGSSEEILLPSQMAYGYNDGGVQGPGGSLGLGCGIRLDQVRAPGEMFALGDQFNRSPYPTLDGMMSEDGTIAPQCNLSNPNVYYDGISTIPPKSQPGFLAHHGRANRAFVDGHLEAEDMRQPFAATDEQLRRWNYDDQPHRDLLARF
jgi:prepilin-type N-terminal cleavage/methylation domain-containing protein/prepilin-type processing-associated H-X9-DG protein